MMTRQRGTGFQVGGIEIIGDMPDDLGPAIDVREQIITDAAARAARGEIVALKDGDRMIGLFTPAGYFAGERLVATAPGRIVIK